MNLGVLFLAAAACGLAPQRQNDFFWENEFFGMRAYGPGDDHVWSGFDVFNKMPDAGITCGELLRNPKAGGDWHAKPYKGILDNYAVGAGRGLGGIAVHGDGEWKTYGNWSSYEILEATEERCVFRLVYAPFSILGKMTCTVTMEKGKRWFRNDVVFDAPKGMRGFKVGPGLDLNPSRGHKGRVLEDPARGILALYEDDRGPVEGATATAVVLDPADAGAAFGTDHQGSRVLCVDKPRFTYYAMAAWSRAGEMTDAGKWFGAVEEFQKQLKEEGKGK